MKSKYPKYDMEKLDEIYDLIYVDIVQAIAEGEKMMAKYQNPKLTYMYARAQMVYYAANVSFMHQRCNTIDAVALYNYFENNGHKEEAALILLWMMTHRYDETRYEEARQLEAIYDKLYSHTAPLRNQIRYLTTKATYYTRNHGRTEQLEIALRAEALLRGQMDEDAWYRVNLSTVLQVKSEAMRHTAEVDKVNAAVEEAIALVDIPGVSPHHAFLAHWHQCLALGTKGHNEVLESLQHYDRLEKRFWAYPAYRHLLVRVYLNMAFLYNKMFIETGVPDDMKQEMLEAQMLNFEKLSTLPESEMPPKHVGFMKLSKARVLRALGRHAEALTLLAQTLRIFSRSKIIMHVLDTYAEASLNYYRWGQKENSRVLMEKAFLSSQKALTTTFFYSQAEGKEKMDAIVNKYELQKKELNEKLLQQKVDAMNKEIQLTSISLHEKVTVLDELKEYVGSLKQKGKETNQLINLISKKIDKVIITEQEKSTLQQKMDESNGHFYKTLSEKHPILTNLEIHICGLLKTGMNDKELAKVYGQTDKSYEQHRYRIKKRMQLPREENLVKYLKSLDVIAQ